MQVLAQKNHVRHEGLNFHVNCVFEEQPGIKDQTDIMVFIVTNALFRVLGLFEHFANQPYFSKMTCTGRPETIRVNCMGSNTVAVVDNDSRAVFLQASCKSRIAGCNKSAPGSTDPARLFVERSCQPSNGRMQLPSPARKASRASAHVSFVLGPGGTSRHLFATRLLCFFCPLLCMLGKGHCLSDRRSMQRKLYKCGAAKLPGKSRNLQRTRHCDHCNQHRMPSMQREMWT